MRLLCFQAKRFWWRTFEKSLPTAPTRDAEVEVRDAVVAFVHVESNDLAADRGVSVLRQAIKHLKWLANKRDMRVIVLHSFTHLGGDGAPPAEAQVVLDGLAERLGSTGYETHVTPFGYLNEWDISVYGHSLAKVWKQI